MYNLMINDKRSLCDKELVWLGGEIGAFYVYDKKNDIFVEAGCGEDEDPKTYNADWVFSLESALKVMVDGD